MRITIADVAEHAGTSPATVSRALNNSGYVSEETRQRIERAIVELDYRPSRMARQMRGKPARLVGLILPYIDAVDYSSFVQHVTEALRVRGYDLILCLNHEDAQTDLHHLLSLRNQGVDGILYTHPAKWSNSTFVRELIQEGMPMVAVMRHGEDNLLHAVISDEERAAYRLMEYVVGKGHRRIGFISSWPDVSSTKHHLAGYRHALHDAGMSIDPDLIRTGPAGMEHGHESAHALLDLDHPPTALFCVSERVLIGVISALQQRGLRVPDDVSLVSNSPADWLRAWNPPITVAGTPVAALAHAAVDALLRRIETPSSAGKPVIHFLDAPMIEGGSVKTV